MNKLITNRKEFLKYKSRFNEIFINEDLGSNPFNDNFQFYLAFEFDFIYHKLFFEGLKNFLYEIKNESVTFYTIEPSPIEYFYKRYGKYSVFEINTQASDEELNDIMMMDPKYPSGDAIALTSDDIAWFSQSNDWAIIGSRDWEVAIVGFTSKQMQDFFLDNFSENAKLMFTTVEQFVDEFKEIVVFNDVRTDFYGTLIKNYNQRMGL